MYDITYSDEHEFSKTLLKMQTQVFEVKQSALRIVVVHAGTDMSSKLDHNTLRFARDAIDNGADVVVVNHPRHVGDLETYRDKAIIYGLGNFVYDDFPTEKDRKFQLVKFTLKKCKLVTDFEVLKGRINEDYQPEITSSKELKDKVHTNKKGGSKKKKELTADSISLF